MRQYEYDAKYVKHGSFQYSHLIQAKAEAGWRVVSVVSVDGGRLIVTFERRIR